jgi:hypothetical protein
MIDSGILKKIQNTDIKDLGDLTEASKQIWKEGLNSIGEIFG